MISIKNEDMIKLDILSAKIALDIRDQTVSLVGIINSGKDEPEGEFASSCHLACMNSLKAAYLLGRLDALSGNTGKIQ